MPEVWRWHPQSISETLEFLTDIRQAFGGEWRDSLKDATQYLSFSHYLNTVEAERMIAAVEANAFGDWWVPEWPNSSKVLTTLASGTDEIDVPVPEAYSVGQKVFISTDADTWEQATVETVTVDSITLTAGLAATYGGNAVRPVVVAPMVLCVAPGGVEFQSTFPSQLLSVSFMSMEPVDLAANDYPVFEDLPVLNDAATPFSPLAGSVSQLIDVVDSKFGAYELQEAEGYVRRRGTASWMDKGHAKMWSRRRFLHFVRGRDGEFWLPTGQNDLRLQTAVDAAALVLLVKGVHSNAAMVSKRICITEGDNQVYLEVLAAATDGSNQELEIDAPGVDFSTDAVVSFMTKSRFDSDSITLEYQFVAGGLASTCILPTVGVV